MIDASSTVVFALAAFLGNFGVAVTGFGNAILFLLVYTIFDLAGVMECASCDIKEAVFIQTLGLASAIPLLIYKAEVHKGFDRKLLMAFIPATIFGTPLGQICQDVLPAAIVRFVVGGVVLFALSFELYKMFGKKTPTVRLVLFTCYVIRQLLDIHVSNTDGVLLLP